MKTFLSPRWGRAFTMIELLAVLSIVAIITSVAIMTIGNYVTQAKKTADRQTLAVINDALNRYKTQGGSVSSLTLGAPIGNVINKLKTPVTWAGKQHQFLKTSTTYQAASLDATGVGAHYRFYRYDTYSENEPGAGEATTNMPYGDGVGYVRADGEETMRSFSTLSSTGYMAYAVNGAAAVVQAHNITPPFGLHDSMTFWSCAGAGDPTPAGYVYDVQFETSNIVAADLRGLTHLTDLSLYDNPGLTSLNLSGLDLLEDVNLTNTSLASFTLPDMGNMQRMYVDGTFTSMSIVDAPNLAQLGFPHSVTSLRLEDCPLITQLDVSYQTFTSLSLSGLTGLREFRAESTTFPASLDLSDMSSLELLYAYGANMGSLTLGDHASLQTIILTDCGLTSLSMGNMPALSECYLVGNNISSYDFSGVPSSALVAVGVDAYTNATEFDMTNLTLAVSTSNYIGNPLPTDRQLVGAIVDLNESQASDYLNNLGVTTYGSEVHFDQPFLAFSSPPLSDAISAAEANGWTVTYPDFPF